MKKQLQNYLVPNEENAYKPHALQRVSVAVMLVLILISFSLANLQSFLWQSSGWLVSSVLPAVIVDLTNEKRSNESLGHLTRNSTLDRAAQRKAEHMAREEYFSHYSPDGVSPWYWFDEAGYAFTSAGENLAVHFTDSDEVIDAWMDSPGHRANILGEAFTEIGVGTAKGEFEGYTTVFVVQLFGTPASAAGSGDVNRETKASAVMAAVPREATVLSGETGESAVMEEEVTAGAVASTAARSTASADQHDELISAGTATGVLYSNLATTSRSTLPPAVGDASGGAAEPLTNLLERTATQPDLLLQLIYGILAVFVVAALIFSIVIEWRRQHPVQIAYGTGLLAAMALLFYLHTTVSAGVMIS